MSIFSRKPKSRYDVEVEVTSLSAVPYINGHCYCKLRLLSCGHFESRTDSKPIQNNQIIWRDQFNFEIKLADHTQIDEARLRISVRREALGGKSEVKIGYIDLSLAQFTGPKSTHQCVLQEYEKTKHRSDNSILRVMARVKNLNHSPAVKSQPTVSQTQNPVTPPTQDITQTIIHKESPIIWPESSYRPAHSRNSSGASGYSSSNNSSEPKTTQHNSTTQITNQALVDSLFKDLKK